jgi:diketogulonate reductase-like aldo/keto reductase
MDFITLNNGVKMPQLGYGVYQVKNTAKALLRPHCVFCSRAAWQ